MSFSLDTRSVSTLKAEAKLLREERAVAGTPLTQGAALEEIARRHGFRDWNTAAALVPDRIAVPVQIGQRVRGAYLGNAFTGMVMGLQLMPDMRHYEVTVKFDAPVNVSRSDLMGPIYRKRVRATVDIHGVSLARTSDGVPHMQLRKI